MTFETYQQFLADGRRGPALTNSISKSPMTRSRLQSLILQGFGQGRGDDYQPWITVTRGNAPRKSNHVVATNSIGGRPMHHLSPDEYRAGRLASWLGAREIRTQFPLFPWRGHPHPMSGLDRVADAHLSVMPGLLEIAHEAGIRHGTYVGAPDIPYVATTDLVARFAPGNRQLLTFWTVKPAAVLMQEKPDSRMRQRIELERLYAVRAGGRPVLYDGRLVGNDFLANLEWLEPPLRERTDPSEIERRRRFVEAFNAQAACTVLRERINNAATAIGTDRPDAQRMFRAAAWLTDIDIDLRQPVLMTVPMRDGGKKHKQSIYLDIVGEAQ